MIKPILKGFFYACLLSAVAFGMANCSDSDDPNPDPDPDPNPGIERSYLNLVVGINVEGSGATYAAAYTTEELANANSSISFKGWGYEVPSVRTARVYASDNGEFLYNLSYGGGTVSKYAVKGGQVYDEIKMLDVNLAMGTANPRWTKVSEDYASIHHVTTEHQYTDTEKTNYDYTATTTILTAVELGEFKVVTNYHADGGAVFEMPRSDEDKTLGTYVWRIDAPAIHNGKAYYGLNKRGYDPATGSNVSDIEYSASSLVVDFPSLNNPKIITSTVGKGSTQGYRTPVAHADEKGDIYQICASPSYMLKISNGDYDNSYVFDLSAKLGVEVGTNGWFYVGDGIGYLPFYDAEKGSGSAAAAWGVARIDLYNKTAVKLNLPDNLWLQQYQYSVLGSDGKFYMALAPLGGEGNIYILDPANTTANGFTKGAAIATIDNTSGYLGIF